MIVHQPNTRKSTKQGIRKMAQQQVSGQKQQGIPYFQPEHLRSEMLTMCQSCRCSIPTSRTPSKISPRKSVTSSKKSRNTSMLHPNTYPSFSSLVLARTFCLFISHVAMRIRPPGPHRTREMLPSDEMLKSRSEWIVMWNARFIIRSMIFG